MGSGGLAMYAESEIGLSDGPERISGSNRLSSERLFEESSAGTSLHKLASAPERQSNEEAMFGQDGFDFSSTDIYGNQNQTDAKVWLGNSLDGQAHGDRVLRSRSLAASKEFTASIQDALEHLPKNLQVVMKDYTIYTAQLPDNVIEERRETGKPISDPDICTALRDHVTATDENNLTQHFAEWRKSPKDSPYGGQYIHFTETHNIPGTVAHEAEHANDAKLGFPSQNDRQFDQLYREESQRLINEAGPDGLAWLKNYIVLDKTGNLSSDGKSELFADLAAIAAVGEPASRGITADRIVAFFPGLYEYVKSKVASGKW